MKKLVLSLLLLLPLSLYASHLEQSQHSIQLGGSENTGNSETTSVNAKISSILQREHWGYEVSLEGQLASSKNVESARSLKANGKVTYDLNDLFYVFNKNSINYDKYATFDFLVREIIGLGLLLKHDHHRELTVEAGPGGVHRRIAGTDDFQNQPIINIAGNYIKHISDTAEFRQRVETDISKSNTHIESVSAIKTSLVKNLALEVSFKVNHDTVIPETSINRIKTDTATVITMIYTFK